MGRKCRKWIWDAGFSETSADPLRRPGTHVFVFVGTFIAEMNKRPIGTPSLSLKSRTDTLMYLLENGV